MVSKGLSRSMRAPHPVHLKCRNCCFWNSHRVGLTTISSCGYIHSFPKSNRLYQDSRKKITSHVGLGALCGSTFSILFSAGQWSLLEALLTFTLPTSPAFPLSILLPRSLISVQVAWPRPTRGQSVRFYVILLDGDSSVQGTGRSSHPMVAP